MVSGYISVAFLKEGESATIDVEPGTHHIAAKIDWAETDAVEVRVAEDETIHFVVRPGGKARQGLRQATKSPGEYLIIERA